MGIGTLQDDKSHGEFESLLGAKDLPVAVRKANLSSVTGVFKGAPRSAQSGISSFKDLLTIERVMFQTTDKFPPGLKASPRQDVPPN